MENGKDGHLADVEINVELGNHDELLQVEATERVHKHMFPQSNLFQFWASCVTSIEEMLALVRSESSGDWPELCKSLKRL